MREAAKTVTVLATDIVGSTEMLERLGASKSTDVTTRHLASLQDALAIHRGSLVKSMGDGVLAIFVSTLDALACAVTIQRSIDRHNRNHDEDRLGVRIGITIGEALLRDGDWYGRPVVEAVRLCAECEGGEILLSDLAARVAEAHRVHQLTDLGPLQLKGLLEPVQAWSVDWTSSDSSSLRVALADDAVMLRQGIAMVLREAGMEIVLEAGDASTLIKSLDAVNPDVVVIDVRMPPTHTTEGLDAAEVIRAARPEIGILMLSASVDPSSASRLLTTSTHGVGYLLKDRVSDVDELAAAVRTIASGGSVIDPAVMELMRR
jgi:class 3 adenylate cyclase/CheY-like chemotaxis protein